VSTKLRIGLAGLGLHGIRYAEPLLDGTIPGAVLSAVSRSDERSGREFAKGYGARFVRDARELATLPGLDAVIAVLPPDLHPDVACACLDAGRPVLVEKPLASDWRSAARVVKRAGETGTPLMVAHTLRFDAVIEAVRRELPSLGRIRLVALNQRFEPTTRGWIDTPGRGGAILNTGVHGFDLLRYFTGAEAESIVAESASIVTRRTEDEFACVVRLEPGGILGTLDNARTTRGRSGRIEVVGERGQVRADHVLRTFARIEGRAETQLGPIPSHHTVNTTLARFVECVRDGTPPPITAEDGEAAVRMVEACARSASEGRRVRLDELR
jgi:predicted dehydrogenase